MEEPRVWDWFKDTAKTYWRPLVLISVITLVMAGILTSFPIVWQVLIDKAVFGIVDYRLSILFFCLMIIEAAPTYLLRSRFFNRYEFETKYRIFKHLLRLPISFHKDRESTKVVLEANKGVGAGNTLIGMFLAGHLLAEIPVAVFAWWYVACHSILAALILTVFLLLLCAGGKDRRIGRKVQ